MTGKPYTNRVEVRVGEEIKAAFKACEEKITQYAIDERGLQNASDDYVIQVWGDDSDAAATRVMRILDSGKFEGCALKYRQRDNGIPCFALVASEDLPKHTPIGFVAGLRSGVEK